MLRLVLLNLLELLNLCVSLIVDAVVVLVGFPRVVGTCLSRVAASGWRFCGDTMWWGMLVVLFLSLEFSGNFAFPPLYVVFALLVLVKVCSLVSLSLLLDRFLLVVVDWWFSVVVLARSVVLVGFV